MLKISAEPKNLPKSPNLGPRWSGPFTNLIVFSKSHVHYTVYFMLLAYLFDSRQIICLLNTNYAFVKALTTAVARNWHTSTPPIDLHLIFEKSSFKNQVGQIWFLIILNLKFAGSQAVKINFEIDQKSSLSNFWFFKNQVQINRRRETHCSFINW